MARIRKHKMTDEQRLEKILRGVRTQGDTYALGYQESMMQFLLSKLKPGQRNAFLEGHENYGKVIVHNCLTDSAVEIKICEWGNPAVDPSMEGYHCM
jgi:hypothetical protein